MSTIQTDTVRSEKQSPAVLTHRKYYVTIDREEWRVAGRWQFWSRNWWIERSRQFDRMQGVGRTIFEVDRDSTTARPLFQLPQRLDPELVKVSLFNQSAWTKSFTRGLRAITPLSDGGFVINDIFGVYDVSKDGTVRRYVSLPIFADLHCVIPNADNTRLLVTSTGTEEIFEIDWTGKVYLRIFVPDLFGLPMSEHVKRAMDENPDHRLIQLNHAREFFHVNWAQWLEEGKRMYVSLHGPGCVATVDVDGDGKATLGKSWSFFPQCHGPAFDFESSTILVAVSKANQVRELSMDGGTTLWANNSLRYSKRIRPVNHQVAVAGDCNGRRLVEIDRSNGNVIWSCDLPGLPYDVAIARQ